MQRTISVLAFVLGFTGVMALAAGWSTPAARDAGDNGPTVRLIVSGTGGPRWVVVESARPSRLYRINAALYADTYPGNPTDSTFGQVMPDGYRCGVNCEGNP